jgi:hypothetical protein
MRNISGLIFDNNVLYTCGLGVQKFVQKTWINSTSFTHYAQAPFNSNLSTQSNLLFYPHVSQDLHKKCAQFISVTRRFYTVSTCPTTITTYNI